MNALIARDRGMTQAIEHAERKDGSFGERAYAWIVVYAATHKQFISEECTAAAALAGLASPADDRAWGAPFMRAARAGVIRKIGFGISRRRHLSPTPLWASSIARVAGKA